VPQIKDTHLTGALSASMARCRKMYCVLNVTALWTASSALTTLVALTAVPAV
jgi:hypothetical protein